MPVALVTGSSRGIGRAVALAVGGLGYDVAVTYRERAAESAEVVQSLEAAGVRSRAYCLDVSDRGSIELVMARVQEEIGPIRALVNNAGVLEQKPFAELTQADWDATLQVNLLGAAWCSQVAFEIMRANGGGSIVNLASSGGQLGGGLAVHYAASKRAVITLTRSLARLGAPDIRVNCVSPGLIETEMTTAEIASQAGREKIASIPLGRVGTADEVAQVVAFLVSDAAADITGQTFNVNGGLYMG